MTFVPVGFGAAAGGCGFATGAASAARAEAPIRSSPTCSTCGGATGSSSTCGGDGAGAACSTSISGACAGCAAGGGVSLIILGFCSAPGAAACCWACGAGGDGLAAGGEETGLGGVSCLVVV